MTNEKDTRVIGRLPAPEHGPLPADAQRDAITAWRARAVHVVLIVMTLAGLPAWGAVILNGLRSGQVSALLWIYLLVYASILVLAFLPHIDHRVRIWGLLLLGYANGCASLARLGLAGSGRLYLMALPIFATVLAGPRAGAATTFLSLATYTFFAGRAGAAEAPRWLEAGSAFAVFVLVTVLLVDRFYRFQLRTLRAEQKARAGLEAAQAQLEAHSRTLEDRVRERTAELAQANRRFEQELLFAGRIQTSFMATELPDIPSWECTAALLPARETSDDFYDVFPLSGNRNGILIADVVDKGVGAALFMSLCWALLHTYARQYPDEPGRALAATNRRILRDTHGGQFVTVFYGVLHPETGSLVYANAGHPPPFHLGKGCLSALSTTGIPLGILEDGTWAEQTVAFRPGDLCLLYTDGVTEAQNRNGDFFETQRLLELLRNSAGRPAVELKEAILDELRRFAGESAQTDDITLLVLWHLP